MGGASAHSNVVLFTLDAETRWILGQTPDKCHGIATRLRKLGHVVAETPEDEQAVSIFWMLQMYGKHNAAWREKGRAALQEIPPEPIEPDDFYPQAVEIVRSTGVATPSSIQRRLRVGYNRAARMLDAMEAEGVISGPNAAGKRVVIPQRDET